MVTGGRHFSALFFDTVTGMPAAVIRLSLTMPDQATWNKSLLQDAYVQHPWMQSPHMQVTFASWDGPFMVIPKELEQSDYAARQQLHLSTAQTSVYPTGLSTWQIRAEDGDAKQWAAATFDHCRFAHPLTWLIPYWKRTQVLSDNVPTCFVQVLDQIVVIGILQQDGTPLLVQQYQYRDEEDFLYFIMLCYKTCNLSPEQHPTILSGEVATSGKLYALLYRYIRTIGLAAVPEYIYLPESLQALQAHQFMDLLTFEV